MSVAIRNTRDKAKNYYIRYGDEKINFERVPRAEGVNRMLIKVHPDCHVVVKAPVEASDSEVINAVKKRARWIYIKLREFRAQSIHVMPRHYVSGESHYYLGKQYLLKVEKVTKNEKEFVKLLRGKIEVHTSIKSKTKDLLYSWYKERAREVFERRLDDLLPQALWVGGRPQVRLQIMKTQWGSCSPGGRLTLNPHLVKAPRECIDYVILHELCHIAEHNHSDKFYRLMKRVMPKWELVKERLDDRANLYLLD